MSKIFLFTFSLAMLFLACEGADVRKEQSNRQRTAGEDELIERYSTRLIASPVSQEEKDQNTILNFLIDSLWDFQNTPSGIYYQIEKTGEGAFPLPQSRVTVHYRGTLLDGREFDSSYKKGAPLMISLNGVIKGWKEALQLLKPGGKGTFIVPSGLAYGQEGFQGLIEPNTVLVFEIELIKFR